MREDHTAAAVAIQSQGIHSITAKTERKRREKYLHARVFKIDQIK
jgi:hypothetical protein